MLKHIRTYEIQLHRNYNTNLAASLQLNKHPIVAPVEVSLTL
jgi:hypothetical protein